MSAKPLNGNVLLRFTPAAHWTGAVGHRPVEMNRGLRGLTLMNFRRTLPPGCAIPSPPKWDPSFPAPGPETGVIALVVAAVTRLNHSGSELVLKRSQSLLTPAAANKPA